MDKYFADISNFSNTDDYLAIVSAALAVDLMIVFSINNGFVKAENSKRWYKTYGLSAILGDIMVFSLLIISTRYFYRFLFSSYSLVFFLILLVAIQIVHDLLFVLFLKLVPKGWNNYLNEFNNYTKEVGIGNAILADSVNVVLVCLFAAYLANVSYNLNVIHLLFLLYFIPFTLYDKT